MKDVDYFRTGFTDPTDKELSSLEILWSNARIEADWIKDRVITYADAIEHNEGLLPYFEILKNAIGRLKKYEELLSDRLTIKIDNPQYSNDYDLLCAHSYHALNKLGRLEDIYDEFKNGTKKD